MKDSFDDSLISESFTERQLKRKEELARKKEEKRLRDEKRQQRIEKGRSLIKYFVIAGVVLVLCGFAVTRLVINIVDLRAEKAAVQKKLDEAQQTIEELEDEYKNVKDPEYIEEKARSLLRMIFPGEEYYIIEENEK